MIIEVRDQEFKIDFINNYVHEKYSELSDFISDLVALYNDITTIAEDQKVKQEELSLKELMLYNKDKKIEIKNIESSAKVLKKNIIDLRQEIIKEVLETNKYEYIHEWWLRKTSAEDCNDFMGACIKKDFKPDGSTVKKKPSTEIG